MLTIFWIIFIITGSLYLLLVGFIITGWFRIENFPARKRNSRPSVSVIIPARNESAGINNLVTDLANQNYPSDKYEVIIVDDHSSPPVRIDLLSSERSLNITVLYLGDNEMGKKCALKKGVLASGSDLILTTDADCRVTEGWISGISDYYVSGKVKLVFGSVLFRTGDQIHEWFQGLEFLSLVAAGAAFAGKGYPIMCNASNMGFERAAYLEFLDKENARKAVSGDDIFFLLWLRKNYPGQTGFIKSDSTIVETQPAATLKEFIHQRLRWTSKSVYYRDIGIISVALIVYFTSLLLFISMIGAFFSEVALKGFLFLFLLKCIIDFVFLFMVTGHYRKKYLLRIFFPLEAIYVIYISVIGLAGAFLPFKWKGRIVRP